MNLHIDVCLDVLLLAMLSRTQQSTIVLIYVLMGGLPRKYNKHVLKFVQTIHMLIMKLILV